MPRISMSFIFAWNGTAICAVELYSLFRNLVQVKHSLSFSRRYLLFWIFSLFYDSLISHPIISFILAISSSFSNAFSDANDHDRPLNKRGKRDAPLMGELLQNEHLVPDLIISSTAKRARSTAKAVAKAAGYEGDVALASLFMQHHQRLILMSYVTCQTNMLEY